MNIISLKTKFISILKIALLMMVFTTTSLNFAKNAQDVEQEILTLLQTCVDTSNKNSFQYFIDQLIAIAESSRELLKELIKDPKVTNKGQYIHDFIRELKKIRNSKNPRQIAQILSKYAIFIPTSKINKSANEVFEIIKFRLKMTGDGTVEKESLSQQAFDACAMIGLTIASKVSDTLQQLHDRGNGE